MISLKKDSDNSSLEKKFFLVIYAVMFISGIYSGMYCYRFGILTDIKHHIQAANYAPKSYLKHLTTEAPNDYPLMKMDVNFKNYIKLSNQRSRFVYSWDHFFRGKQWKERENIRVNSEIRYKNEKFKIKAKLFGKNNDHFRHPYKWSFRVKTKEYIPEINNSRFNLLQPNTRQYITDALCNRIFEKHQILSLNYSLVNLEINKRPADLYFVEDFFSKELIERNQHRDSYIFTFDEVKHPSLDKMTDAQKIDLKMLQKDLREQPYGLMDVEKFDVFTSLLFLAQNKHPILNDNFHFFYNAVTNKVEPLVREVWFESELFIENESDLNKKIATFLNGLKTYNKNLHVYLNGIIDDQKRLSDIQAKVVELAEDIRELNLNPSWCQIKNDIYARFPQALFICKNIDLNTQEILDLNIESKKKAKIENSSIVFKEDVQLTENLHLKNTNLIFNSGISVDLNGHSIFIKNGSIEAISKPKTEIVITNSNLDQGSSIVVDNSKIPNTLRNVRISQLSNHNDRYWHLPGGITFYESDVTIENSVFSSNRGGDDFINFFRCSSFKLNNVRFNDVMADAIDSDFSKGIITNCEFEAIGNDAVDASGSQISVISSHFKNVADKAISAGEGSRVRVTRSKIEDSEISFVAKDDSVVLEDHNELQNNKLDYCIFNKKKEFRNGVLYTDKNITEFNYLIEERSEVFKGLKQIVNLKMVDSVKESLYGIEYGKKSIRQ